MREICIGDIHGSSKKLEDLLDMIGNLESRDKLIFLGDYFDRGPDSKRVFEIISSLGNKHKDRIVFLRGNHDKMLLDFVNGGDSHWLHPGNGGRSTLNEFNHDLDKVFSWILNNTLFKTETKHASYVHAGLYVGRDTPEEEMVWMRDELFRQKQKVLFQVQAANLSFDRLIR